MLVHGCGSDKSYDNFQLQKCKDFIDYEKALIVTIVGGKDVVRDDVDICDYVNVVISYFIKNKKDIKDCVEEDVVTET